MVQALSDILVDADMHEYPHLSAHLAVTFKTVLIVSLGARADAVSLILIRTAAEPLSDRQNDHRCYRRSFEALIEGIDGTESLLRSMHCSTEGQGVSTVPERLGELARPVMTSGTKQCDMMTLGIQRP